MITQTRRHEIGQAVTRIVTEPESEGEFNRNALFYVTELNVSFEQMMTICRMIVKDAEDMDELMGTTPKDDEPEDSLVATELIGDLRKLLDEHDGHETAIH